ncbi:MAG: PHP domain-containing protein [Kangiellaceae bacterium]|nr:PHP domain-containing protein [Kangiellaceae bacterium]
MKFDFHCHSDFSDGTLSPQQLLKYAAEREIQLLSLTDHDTVSGLSILKKEIGSSNASLRLIPGIEISASCDFGEVHIVGLDIDEENQDLIKRLEIQQAARWQRAKLIQGKLSKCGVEGVYDHLQDNVKQVVTRTHIAKAIVGIGSAKDMQQAFKKYIGKKGRARVKQEWMSMEEAIHLIHGAGGMAVLAHPTRYPVSNRKLAYLIESFKSIGGQAIETAYPSLNKDKSAWLELHRSKNGLLASSGSDFHYPDLKWTDLGRFPRLSDDIPHVKQLLSSKYN